MAPSAPTTQTGLRFSAVSVAWLPAIVILLAGLTGAAALWHARRTDDDGVRRTLVDAAGAHRYIEPRLTGGFSYAPVETTRGTGSKTAPPRVPPDLRIAAAHAEEALRAANRVELLATHGAAQLLLGATHDAAATLSEAVHLDGSRAAAWSDLSAALLVEASARPESRARNLVRALDAATRATRLQPRLHEAWFNRALAAEGVLPADDAALAWRQYLEAGERSAWAAEGHTRLKRLSAPPASSEVSRELLRALEALDTSRLARLVREQPQAVREYVQDTLLPSWAAAMRDGNASRGKTLIEQLTIVAPLLRDATSDECLAAAASQLATAISAAGGGTRELLAEGYWAYGEGVQWYAREKRAEARQAFERSRGALAAARSPFTGWANVQLAVIAFRDRDTAAVERHLDAAQAEAERRAFRALTARIRWLRAFVANHTNQIDRALVEYRQAAAIYRELGEGENELSVYTGASDNLRLLGDREGAWTFASRMLAGSATLRHPVRKYLAFYNASLFALDEDLLDAALLLQTSAVRAAERAPTPAVLAEALANRARILHRLGRLAEASKDLDAAAAAAASGAAPPSPYFKATIDAIRGQVLAASAPGAALDAMSRAAAFFEQAEPAQYGQLLLQSGRIKAALGRQDEAERDFRAGIANFEERRLQIRDRALRVSYSDRSWDLFNELIELEVARPGGAPAALAVAERSRARSLTDAANPPRAPEAGAMPPLDEIQRGLARDTAIVVYKASARHLRCWVIARGGTRLTDLSDRMGAVDREIRSLRRTLDESSDPNASHSIAQRLHQHLIAPLALPPDTRVLGIVPDGPLHGLPFVALRDAAGAFLIERYDVVQAPSLAVLLRAAAARPHDARATALLIGNPTIDASAFPALALPTLPDAEAEVGRLAEVYPNATVLVGEAATGMAFLEHVGRHRIIHFAGHAVPNTEYPAFSALALAATPRRHHTGAVFAHEIEQLRLSTADLVVLGACDTGVGYVTRGEGMLSLARAFLVAGVPRVVASLWRVDDRATARLLAAFHRHLREGDAPAHALRRAQLAFLRGEDAGSRHPRLWASFTVFGTLRDHAE
jgi:CHAT domain-containing protein